MPSSGMAPCRCIDENIGAMPLFPHHCIPVPLSAAALELLSSASTRCKSASSSECFGSSCEGGEQTTTIIPEALPPLLCILHGAHSSCQNPTRRGHPQRTTRVECNAAWRACLALGSLLDDSLM